MIHPEFFSHCIRNGLNLSNDDSSRFFFVHKRTYVIVDPDSYDDVSQL